MSTRSRFSDGLRLSLITLLLIPWWHAIAGFAASPDLPNVPSRFLLGRDPYFPTSTLIINSTRPRYLPKAPSKEFTSVLVNQPGVPLLLTQPLRNLVACSPEISMTTEISTWSGLPKAAEHPLRGWVMVTEISRWIEIERSTSSRSLEMLNGDLTTTRAGERRKRRYRRQTSLPHAPSNIILIFLVEQLP